MGEFVIVGGLPLYGEISVQGSKNAVLPILAACLLGEGTCVIENCPAIGDVKNTLKIMEELGCCVRMDGSTVTIRTPETVKYEITGEAASRIRSSILFLGALLGKMRKAVLPEPGGCAIGARPIDLHIASLEKLGVVFARRQGNVRGVSVQPEADESGDVASSGRLRANGSTEAASSSQEAGIAACGTLMHGETIRLRFPSVGATENLLLASVLCEGETVIENGAQEPEIDELCRFLNLRGADIERQENGSIRIRGVQSLRPVTYRMCADRIVSGTYLLAAAATGGCIRIRNFPHGELDALITVLREMGGVFHVSGEKLMFDMRGRPRAVPYLETSPYPGFPTDLQSPLMAVCAAADGVSCISEKIFENRFRTAEELLKMGACISVDGTYATVKGVEMLHGAELEAHDLRGGAALVIAALRAEGESHISGTEYIERGYEDICRDLRLLGAEIRSADGGGEASR